MEDEGILRKGKRSSLWFFSLYIGLAGREENHFFCYAKRLNVRIVEMVGKLSSGEFKILLSGLEVECGRQV